MCLKWLKTTYISKIYYFKQGQTCPLDTPNIMIERRQREGGKEKER